MKRQRTKDRHTGNLCLSQRRARVWTGLNSLCATSVIAHVFVVLVCEVRNSI